MVVIRPKSHYENLKEKKGHAPESSSYKPGFVSVILNLELHVSMDALDY